MDGREGEKRDQKKGHKERKRERGGERLGRNLEYASEAYSNTVYVAEVGMKHIVHQNTFIIDFSKPERTYCILQLIWFERLPVTEMQNLSTQV